MIIPSQFPSPLISPFLLLFSVFSSMQAENDRSQEKENKPRNTLKYISESIFKNKLSQRRYLDSSLLHRDHGETILIITPIAILFSLSLPLFGSFQ